MIIYCFLLLTLLIIFLTVFIIIKLIKLDEKIKEIALSTYLTEQRIIISCDNFKRHFKKKEKTTKPKSKLIYTAEILAIILDATLTITCRKKYERLKLYWEFIKNTMA